jgi:hypothetical protein
MLRVGVAGGEAQRPAPLPAPGHLARPRWRRAIVQPPRPKMSAQVVDGGRGPATGSHPGVRVVELFRRSRIDVAIAGEDRA